MNLQVFVGDVHLIVYSEVEKKFVIRRNHTPSPDKEMIGP
jgi:hypothetical protein